MQRPALKVPPESEYCQVGDAWTLAFDLFDPELEQEILDATATLTITHGGGGSSIFAATMDVDGATASCTAPAGTFTVPERSMRALVTLVVGADTWTILHLFDVVRFSPRMPATRPEIAVQIPNLAKMGTPEDPKCNDAIREAWRDVLRHVSNLALYPDGIIKIAELRFGHLARACELIYGRNANGATAELNAYQQQRWHGEWEAWTKKVKLSPDVDETGTLDPSERNRSMNVVGWGRRQA